MFAFLSYRKNFVGTQKQVRISHGKRAIGVQAIEVRLYIVRHSIIAFTDTSSSNVIDLFKVYDNYGN